MTRRDDNNEDAKFSVLRKRVEKLVLAVGSICLSEHLKKHQNLTLSSLLILHTDLGFVQREEDFIDDAEDFDIPIVKSMLLFLMDSCGDENDNMLDNTKRMKEDVKNIMSDKGDVFKTGLFSANKIIYGTHGWKERYYRVKFGTDGRLRKRVKGQMNCEAPNKKNYYFGADYLRIETRFARFSQGGDGSGFARFSQGGQGVGFGGLQNLTAVVLGR
ncbi:hypothetical protein V2J09_018305 [Rumex salicifolius]